MEQKEKIVACLHILNRLPPAQIQKNVDSLAALIPDYSEDLYAKVDKPLGYICFLPIYQEIGDDQMTGNQYIQSEFNRDGDSFRSPFSNTYDPPLQDGVVPSEHLRSMEEKANRLFNEYRNLQLDDYYEGGVSSCYFWDKDDGNFATAWLVRKNVEQTKGVEAGSWSSINVIDVKTDGLKCTYKITTTVVLEMTIETPLVGNFNVCGTLTKNKEDVHVAQNLKDIDLVHLEKIGTLVEDIEGQLRGYLDSIYVGKTKDIIFQTRHLEGSDQGKFKMQLSQEQQN